MFNFRCFIGFAYASVLHVMGALKLRFTKENLGV